jgi:hypothetical protein
LFGRREPSRRSGRSKHIVSRDATIASASCADRRKPDPQQTAISFGFIEKLRELYGHNFTQMAEIEYFDSRQSDSAMKARFRSRRFQAGGL